MRLRERLRVPKIELNFSKPEGTTIVSLGQARFFFFLFHPIVAKFTTCEPIWQCLTWSEEL